MKNPLSKRITWRSQMIILSLIFLFVFGSGITLIINKHREQHFHDYMFELMSPIEALLENNIIHNMKYHAPDHFQLLLEGLSTNEKIRWVKVLDTNFKVVFANDKKYIGEISNLNGKDVSELNIEDMAAYTSGDSLPVIRIISGVPNDEFCHKCHGSENEVNGYIEIGVNDSAEIKVEAMMLKYDFLSFFFFIAVLSLILGVVHHRIFQKPLTELKAGIERIKAGDLSTRVYLDTPGELSGLAEYITKMTEQLERTQKEVDILHQDQIERASQLASVGELAASVAHEIKNPISGIRNALEIILNEHSDLKEKPIFDEMFSQINRVTKTIRDLMDYAKPRDPKFAPVDIHDVLEQSIALQRPKINSDQIKLEVDLASDCSVIQGDSDLLKQVFANLILNAYQATVGTDGGSIEIRTRCNTEKDILEITVKNTGSWVPEDMKDTIFKPFYTTKHKGTGLGLSLTKSIVEKHGGTISVRSAPEGWTEFKVELPALIYSEGETL